MQRELKFFQAINEAIDLKMADDPSIYLMGLGVPDPKGVFGTTLGLQEKYGAERVLDMPVAENGMTGIAIGSALTGMRPIMVHQRLDFILMAMDQIVNQAAKWHFTFNSKVNVPLVIRMVVGRGWGQGPQHSQSLQALFAHIPGLKVVMPFSPHDAKGLLISSIEDNNPVIFIEHRWLHNSFGHVPDGLYRVPLGQAKVVRSGKDITVAATSQMVLDALKSAEFLAREGVDVEVIDTRSLRPLDSETIVNSVKKTGHFLAVDTGWPAYGFGAEALAVVSEKSFQYLKKSPKRLGLVESPVPCSPALSVDCYPETFDIVREITSMLNVPFDINNKEIFATTTPRDVPDSSFTGPF